MMKKTKTKLTLKQTKSLFFVLLLFLRNGIISKVKNYNINVAFLPIFLLFFGSLGAQTIRVLDVQPTASRAAGAVQSYNLGGSYMTNAKAKLACTSLFGTSGIVPHPITVTTAAGTLGSINAALLANYDVVFMAALVEGFATNYYTPAEIDALKVWSRDPHHVIISAEQQWNQYFTNSMGLSIINGNTDPTTVDAGGIDSTTTKLFSGIFGTPTSAGINQGGSAQGYFTAPCGVWSLAKNAVGNSTIVINNYNDVLFGDGDFFSIISTTGGVSSGCGINSNTDKVWLNLWAWAADQVINGSSSSSYISSAVPPTLTSLTPMPTSSTNTGQIQSTIPTGYTLVGWQTSTDSGSTWTSLGSTANPYTYTNAANGQMYQAIWSGGSGCPNTYSNILTITINRCVTGCNPNTFVNAVDPNTIEYDAMVSGYHSTIVKEADGTFKAWGQETSPNGTGDLLSPTAITSANGFNYIGTPLKATTGSGSDGVTIRHQHALLTTDGLYVWGVNNMLISSSIKNTTAFGKISVNGKTDGLPAGVTPQQVKMMFGSFQTLGIVTCSGDAWVLSMTGDKNGDGSTQNSGTPNSNTVWHRVKTSATADLNGVVAMRGTANALFALTSDSKLYTWGTGTYINSGGATNRTYATEVSVPAGATPKMIGMTEAVTAQSYYLLATDGKLYTMGNNSSRQLGDGTTVAKNTWVQPLKVTDQSGQGTGVLENIAWVSPNEHSRYPTTTAAINVLTNNNKQWAWGYNDNYMLGGASPSSAYDPIYMPGTSAAANGLKVTDELIAVETGGHTSMNIKKGSDMFGYVGHRTNGSMGDGSTANEYIPTYSYQTAIVTVCGADTTLTTDIQVNKVGPLSAQTGSTISYIITVTNNGPDNAANVIVKDPAVANFTATGITCTAGAGTLGSAQCPASVTLAGLQGAGLTIPTLPDGSAVKFTVTGTVGNTAGAVISNVASVEYSNDTDITNNSSTVNTVLYSCTNAETTYAIDVDATLAANTIAVNGGTVNMIYKLKSGTAVPGIGAQLIVPVTYSDLNNQFGVDNQWEALGKQVNPGIDPFVVITPRTTAGTGRLYNSLPANNSTNEALMASNNNGDNIFTSKILSGELDPLGNFSISIGNYPAAPAGYIIKTHVLNAYANGNKIATGATNQSGFWVKQLANTGIRNDGTEAVNSSPMMPGGTYVWRYSAFSGGANFADNFVGTTNVRGVTFWEDSSITFAKICDVACYKPGVLAGTALNTKAGITAISRAGSDNSDNWPMVRKGGWLALESKTKGFVPNRVAFSGGNPVGIAPANFVEGMMVYDDTNKCMKIYTQKQGDPSPAWHCITTQTCPD